MANRKFDNRPRWIRHRRVRRRVIGLNDRPRLSVFRSNKQIYAQVIDDGAGHTLVAASSIEVGNDSDGKIDSATRVGTTVSERAIDQGVKMYFRTVAVSIPPDAFKQLRSARAEGLKF